MGQLEVMELWIARMLHTQVLKRNEVMPDYPTRDDFQKAKKHFENLIDKLEYPKPQWSRVDQSVLQDKAVNEWIREYPEQKWNRDSDEDEQKYKMRLCEMCMSAAIDVCKFEEKWKQYAQHPWVSLLITSMLRMSEYLVHLDWKTKKKNPIVKVACHILNGTLEAKKVMKFVDKEIKEEILASISYVEDKSKKGYHEFVQKHGGKLINFIAKNENRPRWITLHSPSLVRRKAFHILCGPSFVDSPSDVIQKIKSVAKWISEQSSLPNNTVGAVAGHSTVGAVRHSWTRGCRNPPVQYWKERVEIPQEGIYPSWEQLSSEVARKFDITDQNKINGLPSSYVYKPDLLVFTSSSLLYKDDPRIVTLHERVIESYVDSLNFVEWALDYLGKRFKISQHVDHRPRTAKAIIVYTNAKLVQLCSDCDEVVSILRKVFIPDLFTDTEQFQLLRTLWRVQKDLTVILQHWVGTVKKDFMSFSKLSRDGDDDEKELFTLGFRYAFEYYVAHTKETSAPKGAFTEKSVEKLATPEWVDAGMVLLKCLGDTTLRVNICIAQLNDLCESLTVASGINNVAYESLKIDEETVRGWITFRKDTLKNVTGLLAKRAITRKKKLYQVAWQAR